MIFCLCFMTSLPLRHWFGSEPPQCCLLRTWAEHDVDSLCMCCRCHDLCFGHACNQPCMFACIRLCRISAFHVETAANTRSNRVGQLESDQKQQPKPAVKHTTIRRCRGECFCWLCVRTIDKRWKYPYERLNIFTAYTWSPHLVFTFGLLLFFFSSLYIFHRSAGCMCFGFTFISLPIFGRVVKSRGNNTT